MDTMNLALGAMKFGTTVDERTAFGLLDQFVDAGGSWIDTADCYAFWDSDTGYGGQSEEVLGRWLAARPGMRDRVRISTKFGAEPVVAGRWPASRTGLGAAEVRAQLEGSLRRLGTDRVDLAWAHMEDRTVSLEDVSDTLSGLHDDGLAARLGMSNHAAWRVATARARALGEGREPVSALQYSYSYLHPRPGTAGAGHRFGFLTDEHLDLAATGGLEIWAYSPLLGGAYDNPTKEISEEFDHPGTSRRLAALDDVSDAVGLTQGQVVLAWLAGHEPAVRPILGGSKPEQLAAAMTAVRTVLPDDARARLDAVEPLTPTVDEDRVPDPEPA
ncbi:aldo/keto reductase [Myceligenerans pegani]|uniref:Aldo/keto reductase n=1 Tax=Myceligenerans pegani TaxID=2776917 RepID=A0ABR9N4D3_9MICO|nr:aldo/keto reductase [Myceligenerans sp. TRM 65318]MBE1878532.1 aldo/keto reductase [Myceligenerans sp. TRM 65318]MBE3020803.1 aldo/keto reductase [Myceligenerans sp. TRM 65318]